MCWLVWSTLYLGYLPDRYVIFLIILRLTYVARLTMHILRPFLCLKVDWNYMIGQMCVHHMCLPDYLLLRYSMNPVMINCFVFLWTNKYVYFLVWYYSSATSTSDSMRAKANNTPEYSQGKRSNPSNKRGNGKKKATNELKYVISSVVGSVITFVTCILLGFALQTYPNE